MKLEEKLASKDSIDVWDEKWDLVWQGDEIVGIIRPNDVWYIWEDHDFRNLFTRPLNEIGMKERLEFIVSLRTGGLWIQISHNVDPWYYDYWVYDEKFEIFF